MLKILIIAPLSTKLGHGKGGVENSVENILNGFANIPNLEILLLSFTFEKCLNTKTKYFNNSTIIQKGSSSNNTLFNILKFQKKTIRQIINEYEPNLIHFHGTGPNLMSIIGIPKKSIIITQHGINRIELKYQSTLKNIIKFLFKSLIEYYYFPRFQNYIFISKNNLELTEKYFPIKNINYKIIPNAVNEKFFKIAPKQHTDNNILYVGSISRLKNIFLLLKTLNDLKNNGKIFNLTVIGNVKDKKYYKKCQKYILENQLSKYISFKGPLSQIELISIYSQIDIFVLPSQQENYPISVLEAMAASRITVASDVGGVSEIINNRKTGFIFKNNNHRELYNILFELYNNDRLIHLISSQAKKFISKTHSPQHIARSTNKFYKSIYQLQFKQIPD